MRTPSADAVATRPLLVPLLRAAQRDDGDSAGALDTLMGELYRIVHRFLGPRLAGWRDATDVVDDVTQETLVRLFLGFRGCRADHEAAIIGWACTVARHTLIDLLRSPGSGLMGRQFAAEIDDGLRRDDNDAGLGRHAHVVSETPEESAGTRPEQSAARERLLALAVTAYNTASNETGELLWWRLVMGAEWSEVAAHVQSTAAGAKRRFQRAQAALERTLVALINALPDGERQQVQALVQTFDTPAASTHTAHPRASAAASRSPRGAAVRGAAA